MILALVGNQNCGKTTLFNCLTGSDQHVGNFPGVTVDQKIGDVRGVKDCSVVDLPGIYSIRPYSTEEKVTRDFIFGQRPDGIINIIDATNPQRNLYLTLQLLELKLPMVVALNMMDELVGNGGSVDIPRMERELGVPVVPISAMKNEGVGEVIDRITAAVHDERLPQVQDFCPAGPVHRCIHAVSHIIEDHAQKLGIAPRFCATKVIEEDPEFIERLALDQNELELIEHSVVEMEDERGLDRNAALADMRYAFIERVCDECVIRPHESREHRRSVRIDRVLTNRFLALPLFLLIMLTIFWLTFSVIGQGLSDLLADGIDALTVYTDFDMDVVAVGGARHSDKCDRVALAYLRADRDEQRAAVRVQGRYAVSVVDYNVVSVAPVPFRAYNGSAARCHDRRTGRACDINRPVEIRLTPQIAPAVARGYISGSAGDRADKAFTGVDDLVLCLLLLNVAFELRVELTFCLRNLVIHCKLVFRALRET